MITWKTETRRISSLAPFDKNPRRITEEQAAQLRKSIEKFNFVEIPVINTDSTIIAGHQRLKIMHALGRGGEEVDVRVPNRLLTEAEVSEYCIRSNKNTGEWDLDLLGGFGEDLLADIGFDSSELDKIFPPEEADTDDVPEVRESVDIKAGDIFQLGDHRLMCGDATEREDVARLMDGQKADIIIADPPYGVSYADKNKFLNSISPGNRIQNEIKNDHWTEDETCEFWLKSFEVMRDVLADVNSYYIFGPQIQGMMMMMMMKAGLPYKHVIIWVKNNHVLGRCDYNYKHEPMFFGWTKTHKFKRAGDFLTSVWTVDKPHKSDLHPTMKPVELLENALLNSSDRGGICLDPFGGSGSTLIACERLNRRCYMMELDAKYVQVIIDRWEKYTGNQAVKL